MSGPLPTGPAELVGAPRWDLVHALDAHEGLLVDARHHIGRVQPPARLQTAALDALAVGQALADNALRHRWLTVVEALSFGATLAQVCAAADLDPDEIAAGVRSWASGQVEHCGMTSVEHDAILARLDAAGTPPRG